ncbi:hypothetical protein [Streptomyces sp. RK62]|uniref:hypothetical protein n=1 Tax=Streptomyces sp. RK62 TaxID=2824893 RepID=UPI001B37A503|nr:hypothetical protein [Streptomyces sp. RK62]MBQ0997597.1 hypothetical protein [Streptomyces sp. RK62]
MLMMRQRVRKLRFAAVSAVAVVLASGWVLIREWSELPSVPSSVAQSVQSEDVRILAEREGTNPGNDWEQSYVLVATSPYAEPVDAIEGALRSTGWVTSRGDSGPLVLGGDRPKSHPEYGVTVQRLDSFMDSSCFEYEDVCEEFKKAARGKGLEFFVVDFMPYV